MKINYDMNDNYKKLYDEANGVLLYKKRILKNEEVKFDKFSKYVMVNFLKMFVSSLSLFVLNRIVFKDKFSFYFSLSIIFFSIFFLLFNFISFYIFVNSKKNSRVGVFEINKDGLIDTNKETNNKTVFKYNDLEGIIVTDNIIVFITNKPIFAFLQYEDKEEIIKCIRKYSDIKIVK